MLFPFLLRWHRSGEWEILINGVCQSNWTKLLFWEVSRQEKEIRGYLRQTTWRMNRKLSTGWLEGLWCLMEPGSESEGRTDKAVGWCVSIKYVRDSVSLVILSVVSDTKLQTHTPWKKLWSMSRSVWLGQEPLGKKEWRWMKKNRGPNNCLESNWKMGRRGGRGAWKTDTIGVKWHLDTQHNTSWKRWTKILFIEDTLDSNFEVYEFCWANREQTGSKISENRGKQKRNGNTKYWRKNWKNCVSHYFRKAGLLLVHYEKPWKNRGKELVNWARLLLIRTRFFSCHSSEIWGLVMMDDGHNPTNLNLAEKRKR